MKSANILFLNLILLLGLLSCAKTPEEELDSAIKEARYHLTNRDCSDALDVLDDVGQEKDDAEYVSVYASAIACQAGYSDLDLLNDLENIDENSSNMLSSLAAFSVAEGETSADETSYSKIIEAVDYLINADGGTSPSTTARLAKYGTKQGNDLSMQALLMITTAFSKYLNYYGNTDSAGVQGSGPDGNECIIFYPFDANVNTDLSTDNPDVWGDCNDANDGHPDLDDGTVAAATVKRRLCEGIILFNNLYEILQNIQLSSNSSLGNLDEVEENITELFTTAQALEGSKAGTWGATAITDLKDITSQSECETQTDADIQRYFLVLFETSLL